jgi:DNA-directed RNA polymerase specialized sigma24 family protein
VPDVKTEAIEIAHGILSRRVFAVRPSMYDREELRQDLALAVLENLKYYRPEKGSLKTFVGMTFDQWWKRNIKERATRAAMEGLAWDLPDRPSPEVATELSDRGRRIVAQLPPHVRESAVLRIAYDVPLVVVAELTGAKYHTANQRVMRARRALKEMA